MIDAKKELEKDNIILLTIPSQSYSQAVIDLARQLNINGGLYVTLNNPYAALTKRFKENKIDCGKYFFIDTVSAKAKLKIDVKNCVFVSSPSAITELSIAINEYIKNNKGTVIFDSLSTLSIYLPIKTIIGFAHSLVTKIKENNVKAVFPITKNEELIKNLCMFISKVVELKE